MTIEHEALLVNEIITRFNELNPRQQHQLAFELLNLCDPSAVAIIRTERLGLLRKSLEEYRAAHPEPTK
jgi:hypothetical protein